MGSEAFETIESVLVYREELKELARVGETDIMHVPDQVPGLSAELRLEDDIPITSLRGLVLMKLDAFRARDQEDVRSLLTTHPGHIREVRDYLQTEAPELLTRLAEALVG